MFAEQCECREAEIFISIPCLLVLLALGDEDRKICKRFFANMFKEGEEPQKKFAEMKRHYKTLTKTKGNDEVYNQIEKIVLGISPENSPKSAKLSPLA